MVIYRTRQHLIAAVAAFGALFASSSPNAQELYAGKTINVIIGNTAGSGYDAYGRILGRYMAKYLPGQPKIVPQNMPGAGSVRAADNLYNIAPKDGTTFGLLVPGALIDPLTGDPADFRYEPTKFEYIGTADSGTRICFSRAESPVKTFEDARRVRSVAAGTAASSTNYWIPALTKADFQAVNGYPGPADMFLALERGEADVICGLDLTAVNTLRPGLIGSNKVNLLLQIGKEQLPSLTALGVPPLSKFVEDADRPLLDLLIADQWIQRPFVAPPGTPARELAALRSAFEQALKDPELLAEAQKASLAINPKSGADVAAHINMVYAAPKELRDRMRTVMRAPK